MRARRGDLVGRPAAVALERNGFPEECYFTFSYSPIRDEAGGVGGILCAVTETTAAGGRRSAGCGPARLATSTAVAAGPRRSAARRAPWQPRATAPRTCRWALSRGDGRRSRRATPRLGGAARPDGRGPLVPMLAAALARLSSRRRRPGTARRRLGLRRARGAGPAASGKSRLGP